MCGIAGLYDLNGRRRFDRGLLARMNGRLAHRGPDGEGFLDEPGCALAHRRLAIIDLAGGDQPLYNEDGSVGVVFNGEIYNYAELTRTLEERGHRFRTRSDTEVIVHGWEEWGEACVERFRGMFAFALWDRNRESLFLARDRLGIKPLYYALLPDRQLVFGSELKALLVHPDLQRRLDPTAVEDYFAFGYVPDPKTIYATVAKLPPAHTLLVGRGDNALRPRRYWELPALAGDPPAPGNGPGDGPGDGPRDGLGDAPAELIERLREAVRIRLVSEVPLGAFLSGGIDSSAVVAMMAGLSDAPVNTCSIGFDNAAFDETRYAAAVAERYGTNHHVRTVDSGGYDLIDRLVEAYDEPFADSSALPTYRVCALARERVTVALSGDGGDELFWGYLRYRWHDDENRLRRRLGPVGGQALARLGAGLCPRLPWLPLSGRVGQTLETLGRDPAEAFFHTVSVIGDDDRAALYGDGLRRALNGYRAFDTVRAHYDSAPTDHPVGRVQHVDLMTYLPGDILTKVDRVSMAHALEVRVPILDHPLVEWAHGLPSAAKLSGGEGKRVFKRAVEPYLPHDLIYRRKMGFAVPLDAWFRGPLRDRVRDAVLGPTLAETGLFDRGALAALVDRHQSGARDSGPALWALLMFEGFLRKVHAH